MKTFKTILLVVLLGSLWSACTGSGREDLLVGKWKLSNYTDNVPRNVQEQAEFQQLISGLRIDLEMFADGTFSRSMLQPGTTAPVNNLGEWYLENEEKILTMKVEGSPLSKLLIVEAAEEKLVLQVEEGGVSTTLTFVH